MNYCYDYPRPAVCVDIILIDINSNSILLIQRKNEPFKDYWAFPGGFVDENEDIADSAHRELFEETSVEGIELVQFKTYGTPNRDPRGHVISVIYFGYCNNEINAKAGDDAKNLKWFNLEKLPDLAFDHKQIIDDFLNKNK